MTAITKARRVAAFTILDNSNEFNPETMVIHRDGYVSAIKDADKTFNGPETVRYVVGHINDMVNPDGVIREGY